MLVSQEFLQFIAERNNCETPVESGHSAPINQNLIGPFKLQKMPMVLFLFHVPGINVLCGIGTLAVPHAVREGGWLSLLLLLLFCIICLYTGILLKRCLEGSPGLKTYPDIGQAAFGMSGRLVIAVSTETNNDTLLVFTLVLSIFNFA